MTQLNCSCAWKWSLGVVAALGLGLGAYLLLWNDSTQPQVHGETTPAASAKAFQTTEKLRVAIDVQANEQTQGELKVALVDDQGKTVSEQSQNIEKSDHIKSYPFELPPLKGAPKGYSLRYQLGEEKQEIPLKDILLVKAHETALTTGQDFFVDSPAALRCEVYGVKSLTDTVPLRDASVKVQLRSAQGKVHELTSAKAGDDGIAEVRFKLPDVEPGQYKMEVITKSNLGEEKLERNVNIKKQPKILLITDKPLYQPGQTMHIRALSLDTFSLKPVANTPVTFEVEDAKGNKVFKRENGTNEYGIAHIDFELASEVNEGTYRIRALLGKQQSEKSVTVQPYTLPKFKSNLTADKKFYQPKETIKAELQVDYFFGKPVSKGKVVVKASTFDVAFKQFTTWNGNTDENGHVDFEIKLPDYFVGLPLNKGNALVKLDVEVTDTADQKVNITKTFPVSGQSMQVSLIPEAGRLVPGVENKVYIASIYPDGSPAKADIDIWMGQKAEGKPLTTVKTNSAGLAEFRFTPQAKQFRNGGWENKNVEMLGGNTHQVGGQKNVLDVFVQASDAKGNTAKEKTALTSEPLGENVLLRMNKAIYGGGEQMKVDILTSAGLPTVYFDVIRSGQTMLTKWMDVKDGKASQTVTLPAGIFGTLEVHAYQMLSSGEIIRDSRVIYVQPAKDLKINVKADKDTYRPGESGTIRFEVTDSKGNPTQSALGVLIVDEAVYALQEMQPGLEKVYFTLQKELVTPKVQIDYKPREQINDLVRVPALPPQKQQIAAVLMTAVRPKAPKRWQVNPALERQLQLKAKMATLANLLHQYSYQKPVIEKNKEGKWEFRPDLFKSVIKHFKLKDDLLKDPLGGELTLKDLQKVHKNLSPENLAESVTYGRMQNIFWGVRNFMNRNRNKYFKNNTWTIPKDVMEQVRKMHGYQPQYLADAWGTKFTLVTRKDKAPRGFEKTVFANHNLASAGPDQKLNTKDDVIYDPSKPNQRLVQQWGGMFNDDANGDPRARNLRWRTHNWNRFGGGMRNEMFLQRAGGAGFGGGAGGIPMPTTAQPKGAPGIFDNLKAVQENAPVADLAKTDSKATGQKGGSGAPIRVREYFPETMLWRPALITDKDGKAELPLSFADSITTWRLTASASSAQGLLGGTTASLRVFQDFFVDMDLPVDLTQNDEVAFPLAVYNYLKEPQTVTITLEKSEWFDLIEGEHQRSLALQPGQVTAVKFRIRAKKIGHFPLTVKARGSKMSDAVRRIIEVVPDGRKIESVTTDRLEGSITETINIPNEAIADASKILVKLYPGVTSQVMEGAEGMMRMPGGCMEQTSSSAYPNVLIVDYAKKTKTMSPALLMKAEKYLNVGYQRLLTFERPGGGFDWWGRGKPLVWLSAYGLQEFADMSKVYPIDLGIIERTQQYLLRQQDKKDGTWSKIGATHGVSIERMGDPKLLLTSYVMWSLLDSGVHRGPNMEKAIKYIRDNVKTAENAYILALAANALASWDAKHPSTVAVLQKLRTMKQNLPKIEACCFPAKGQTLTHARGDYMTVETTAMTILAMLKAGGFTQDVNKGMTYLIKAKGSGGTWGSTQATILSLKALVAAAGGQKQKDPVKFTLSVNGKQVAKGEVNEKNFDVMQQFDLKEHTGVGANEVKIEVDGKTSMMYQIVGRHFEPWGDKEEKKPVVQIGVEYDRTELTTNDILRAKATLKYQGEVSTYQVIVDLGIPPGFKVDPGDFAEMVGSKKIEKFSVTSQQVTLYVGSVKPGDTKEFEYTLKPKYPIKAKTPVTKAYEYYTPSNNGSAKPVMLTVTEKK